MQAAGGRRRRVGDDWHGAWRVRRSTAVRTTDDVAFEFHKLDRELKIEARSNGRSSEARIPLPA